ncbi:MAG: multidrug efflux SMR transporter [Myxococcales bacterium]|nr:multidrug efflux SMR transporter [Myxococcales bacterium]
MAWLYLLIAGLFEMGWPVGLKLAQREGLRVVGLSLAVLFMAVSGWLLWLAQREIPLGTSYAVWTGMGAAGTFVIGLVFFGDPTSVPRFLGVALILVGVVLLKVASG